MVKIGRLWFQWRSLSPLPLFVLMLFLRPDLHLSPVGIALAALVVAGAEGIRIWAVGYAGSATRTRGDKIEELVTAGPYRYVRNPLYVANILLYTGCAVLFGFRVLSLVIFVFSCLQYTFIVAFEEEMLGRTFGERYQAYREKVPRWLVSPVPCVPSSSHTFDLGRALRSERSTFYSIGAMACLFLIKYFLGLHSTEGN